MTATLYDTRVTVDFHPLPCGRCGLPTMLRFEGAPGHRLCFVPDEVAAESALIAAAGRAGIAVIVREPAPEPAPAAEGTSVPPKLLKALETDYAPKRRGTDGRMHAPYWRPEMPAALELVQITTSWSWSRRYAGEVVVLDRSGAWIAAASSVEVAHGALEHTGEIEYTGRPGLYEVAVYDWREDGVPNPLGRPRKGQETIWVTHARVKLLADLAAEGRWPDASVIDSYTGEPVRLRSWAGHVSKLRADALKTHGRDSEQYDQVKVAFSQAVSLMIGHKEPGRAREWKCKAQRPDWALAIQDQAAVTMWRWADDCRKVAELAGQQLRGPYGLADTIAAELAPVAIRNVDELVIPAAALELVTTTERPGGRKPLQLDPLGVQLGTFKVKGYEVRRG